MIVLCNGVVLIPHVAPATSFTLRLLGYMGRATPPAGHALYLAPCRSIHTCFMRFPIAVIFLDRNLRIVKLIHNLRPWRIALGPSSTAGIIELPAGNSILSAIHPGDTLELVRAG